MYIGTIFHMGRHTRNSALHNYDQPQFLLFGSESVGIIVSVKLLHT